MMPQYGLNERAGSPRRGGLALNRSENIFNGLLPILSDEPSFLAAVRGHLRSQPELVHAWQSYVDDKRGTPSPYLDLRSAEVGWMNTRGKREDISRHDDEFDAAAQFIWREAGWVLTRQRVT